MEAREEGWEGADPGAEIRGEREPGFMEEGGRSPINQDRIPPSEEPRLSSAWRRPTNDYSALLVELLSRAD